MEQPNLVANIGEMTPTTVRRTRGALSDLSRQMAGVAVTLVTTPNNQIPSSLNTPASSPDEMVIRLRGHKNPVTWSPLSLKEVKKLSHYEITPTKDVTPTRVMLGLRVSPRKRLQLTEGLDKPTLTSPEKTKKVTIQNPCKKPKIDSSNPIPLGVALKGLSHAQLINLINRIAFTNPDVKRMLESSLPEPDLQPMLDELVYLKKNIFKSLPSCRLSSKTDSAAFNKASVHLSAFKRHLLESCKILVDSNQWKSVVDFTICAWIQVKSTPQWDNAQHNSIKKHCLKALASNCLLGLKNIDKDYEWMLQIKERLERLQDESDEELMPCISYLGNSLTGLHKN